MLQQPDLFGMPSWALWLRLPIQVGLLGLLWWSMGATDAVMDLRPAAGRKRLKAGLQGLELLARNQSFYRCESLGILKRSTSDASTPQVGLNRTTYPALQKIWRPIHLSRARPVHVFPSVVRPAKRRS
jgi:hypothetical protein